VSRIEGVGYGREMVPVGLSFDEVDRRGLARLRWIHVEPAKGVRLCGLRIRVCGLRFWELGCGVQLFRGKVKKSGMLGTAGGKSHPESA